MGCKKHTRSWLKEIKEWRVCTALPVIGAKKDIAAIALLYTFWQGKASDLGTYTHIHSNVHIDNASKHNPGFLIALLSHD